MPDAVKRPPGPAGRLAKPPALAPAPPHPGPPPRGGKEFKALGFFGFFLPPPLRGRAGVGGRTAPRRDFAIVLPAPPEAEASDGPSGCDRAGQAAGFGRA